MGGIVLIKDDTLPRNEWLMGRVIATKPDSKGYVRSVILKTSTVELPRGKHGSTGNIINISMNNRLRKLNNSCRDMI